VARDRPDSALGGPVREGLAEDRPEHCSEVRVNLGDKQPFYQRHQFAGQFVVGDLITDPVDLVIDFNELDGGRIEGYVLGDNLAARAIRPAFDLRVPCRIVSAGDQARMTGAEGVLITKLTNAFGHMLPFSGTSGIVAEFSCREVSETIQRQGPSERGIIFSLAGPLGVLEPREIPTSSWTGGRTVELFESDLDLGVPWHGRIELRNHYLWEQIAEDPGQGRYARIPSLVLGCEASQEDLPDDVFLSEAKQLAEDVTLLMSVAARQWVVWYQYSFWTPSFVTRRRSHSSRQVSRDKHRFDDSPVGLKGREFLKVCLPRFREGRSLGEDLRLPIAYWVPKVGSRYVEERFAAAFWALEKLVDLFVERAKRDRIVGSAAFERVEQCVKAALEQVQLPEGRWGTPSVGLGMLREKLPELNRPSIASQLQWLCDSLGVTWRDLYPPNVSLDRPRFIRTRNEIFHSNAPVDGAFVLRETYRVSALFERLILKALGWTDLSATGSAGAEIPITDDL
jgi:hypothetical protein